MHYLKTLPNHEIYHEFPIQYEKIVGLLYYTTLKKTAVKAFLQVTFCDHTVLL
jgi:hypothetical protein